MLIQYYPSTLTRSSMCSFTGTELRNKVDAAAHFEGAHGLIVFVFAELYTYQI